MTRIDFYVLADGATGDRLTLACRIAERAYADGRRVLIHCPDASLARQIDRLLWTWREDSFMPHGLVGETDAALTPVLISTDGEPAAEDQVLINLSPELDQDPAVLQAGRQRWKYYRDCGYDVNHHEVR